MFGYVTPYKAVLLVKEYDEYRAIYCTLCKKLAKNYGFMTRFFLSFDLCFYTMLSLNYKREAPIYKKEKHCFLKSLRTCYCINNEDEIYDKAAAITILMTYHKLLDTLADENFKRRMGARFLLLFFSRAIKKAQKHYPHFSHILENLTQEQCLAENKKELWPQAFSKAVLNASGEISFMENCELYEAFSIDNFTRPTAKAVSLFFEEINEDQSSSLNRLGFFLGRWAYLIDAMDDFENDVKNNKFNPLVYHMQLRGIAEEDLKFEANALLNQCVGRVNFYFSELEKGYYTNTLENILKLGLAQAQRRILYKNQIKKEG